MQLVVVVVVVTNAHQHRCDNLKTRKNEKCWELNPESFKYQARDLKKRPTFRHPSVLYHIFTLNTKTDGSVSPLPPQPKSPRSLGTAHNKDPRQKTFCYDKKYIFQNAWSSLEVQSQQNDPRWWFFRGEAIVSRNVTGNGGGKTRSCFKVIIGWR